MIKMSQEIYNKIKSPDIAMVIEVCRMEWLWYVVRMDGVMSVKKLLEGKLRGWWWWREDLH
jgi:hypothetical protein